MEPSPTNTQPLTFPVTARAPSTGLQAPAIGLPAPSSANHFREQHFSKLLFTRTIRTALALNGLGTVLLAIRNALCRTRSSRAFTRKPPRLTRLSTQGESYRAPFHPSVAPRRLVKDPPRFHSSYAVLHSGLSTPSVHGHRYVWPTSAIPHFKNEYPMFRVTTESLPEFPPTRSRGPCGSRRVARFGRRDFSLRVASILRSRRAGCARRL